MVTGPMAQDYSQQHRGGDEAYQRYLAGMDKSMRQKVALTAAHLLGEGRVADMGMGSGTGTQALASLYPRMRVVGVDVNPEMVERARAKLTLENLAFVTGDIAQRVFEPNSLDAIFDSSVLHHVTSFSGYDHEAAARALTAQVEQLAPGGSLIVRDFVAPPSGLVLLDLPASDGDDSDDPTRCSTARLFERLAREFRPLSANPGFAFEAVSSDAAVDLQAGWRRFRVERRLAAEFLLRKDYRADWATEVLEEYTYFDQPRFEAEYSRLGLRLLASFPIHNPWIVQNRYVGRALLRTPDGEPEDFPPTNLLIVGEKVREGEGVRFVAGELRPATGFLVTHCYRHVVSGSLRDLVRRRGTAIDVVPWFEAQGALYVLARKGHPRPVLQTSDADPALDGGSAVGYVTEPILTVQTEKPLGVTVEDTLRGSGIGDTQIVAMQEASRYYPSPGGLMEQVRAVHVRIAPTYLQRDVDNQSGFTSGGSVRAIDAHQLLRAAQVGALPDARLELNVYELLLSQAQDPGPWIGAEICLTDQGGEPPPSLSLTLPRRRSYVPASPGESAGFLELRCRDLRELSPAGEELVRQPREYALPRQLSTNTVSCALLRRRGGVIELGLDEDDLPAVQAFEGTSAIWVTPAWRLPRGTTSRAQAQAFVTRQLSHSYGVEVRSMVELGGRYHPSAGVTPEIVFPYAVDAVVAHPTRCPLRWVALAELVANAGELREGHLRIACLRSAHALGLLAARVRD
jgi:SAM-dependent methyltransferase